MALCAIGGLIGLALATVAGWLIAQSGIPIPLRVEWRVWTAGIIAILLLSIAVGLLPALRAKRLKIVDALAGR